MTSDLTTKAAEIRAGLVMTSVEKVVGEWRAAMEGVTPGEWAPGCIVRAESGCQCRYIFGGDYMGAIAEVYVDNGIRGLENGQNDCPPVDEARANAAWIAHCSPAGIASLLALIESLIKENAALSNGVSEIADQQQPSSAACCSKSEDKPSRAPPQPRRATAAEAERDELLREKERMKAALRPFADEAASWEPPENGGYYFENSTRVSDETPVTVGDLRRARAALPQEPPAPIGEAGR